MNKTQKLVNYLKKVVKDSTKRFIFIYLTLVVLTPLMFTYTSNDNFEVVLAELLGFLGFLAGGGVYESIKKQNK